MLRTASSRAAVLLTIAALLGSSPAVAQVATNGADPLTDERYVRPPSEIERLVLAPRHLNTLLTNQSPTRRAFLRVVSAGLPTVERFGRPWHNLAGLQVDPRANRARTLTTRGAAGLEVVDAVTGRMTVIEVPAGATVSGARWSPDGSQVAFVASFDDASHLYVADVATGRSRRLTTVPLLATLVTEPEWTANGTQLLVVLLPENRGAEPRAPAIAMGPKVRLTQPGVRNRTRTYADLLEWPHEHALVEYFVTGQLAAIDARSRAVRRIGSPAMIKAIDPSPSGAWIRVATIEKPFSYTVPVSAFGWRDEIVDANGRTIAQLGRRPLRASDLSDDDDDAPRTDTTKRHLDWVPNSDAIAFVQTESAGAAGDDSRGRTRDVVHFWSPPFDSASRKVLLESTNRVREIAFSGDGGLLFLAETVSGFAHVYAVATDDPSRRYTLTRVRGLQPTLGTTRGGGGGGGGRRGGTGADSVTFYENPGTLVTETNGVGTPTVLTSRDGRYAYLSGTQYYRTYSDSAPQPFLDRIEVRTGQKTRLFTSARDAFEEITAALDPDFASAIVNRESPTTVPDSYRRDMRSGTLTKLTSNRDYTPEMTTAQRQMLQITRADGYKFWTNVILPREWRVGGPKLPTFIWFYPYEFTDQSGYDRSKRTYNKNRFPSFNALSKAYLITQGYAVVEPDIPIFGAQGRMNDNYIPDLRNSLAAVIDELERRGITDRQRVGAGGHSYGAFSTVNAMVHTPFFKAGIAGDGNYNRTLTPNTFQSERRDLWEARETYLAMSPLLYADRLSGALLMYHNLEDQNVGTDPINSIRLFHALQGMGKPAALYMHPYEDHGPATRETVLDLWARWTAWLDRHLKQPGGKVAND